MDGFAVTAGVAQFVQTVMVARDEKRGNSEGAEQADGLMQPDPLGREVTRAHHDVGLPQRHRRLPVLYPGFGAGR